MKKIIAVIAALSMSALMLTGCDKKNTGDDALTESITTMSTVEEPSGADSPTAEDSAKTEEKKDEATTAAEETEAQTEAEVSSADVAASYASLEEFINADDIFDHEGQLVDGKDSYTYAFVMGLEGGNGFYIDMEAVDGSMKMVMAMASQQIAITIIGEVEGVDGLTNISVIITDGKMYMLDITSKSGFYMTLNEEEFAEMFAEYDPEEILSEININTDSEVEGVMSYKVDIGGKIYTFEYQDDSGMLYDANGKVCTAITGDSGEDIPAIIFNEFSTNVPANAFDVPSGYEIIDMSVFG